MTTAMPTRPFSCYQQDVISVLRGLAGRPITAEWWNAQRRPDGQHRTWTHYQIGLPSADSARELLPFALAQIGKPVTKPEHWKDVCISFERE